MLLKGKAVIGNVEIRTKKDNSNYARVKIMSADDSQVFDVSINDPDIYNILTPFSVCEFVFQLTNSNYGMALTVKQLISAGNSIIDSN